VIECKMNGVIQFRTAMQRFPPVFNNGIRLCDKIPVAGRHTVHINATDTSEQHCGSPTFCAVRALGFSREDRDCHLNHQMPQWRMQDFCLCSPTRVAYTQKYCLFTANSLNLRDLISQTLCYFMC